MWVRPSAARPARMTAPFVTRLLPLRFRLLLVPYAGGTGAVLVGFSCPTAGGVFLVAIWTSKAWNSGAGPWPGSGNCAIYGVWRGCQRPLNLLAFLARRGANCQRIKRFLHSRLRSATLQKGPLWAVAGLQKSAQYRSGAAELF